MPFHYRTDFVFFNNSIRKMIKNANVELLKPTKHP